MKKVYILTHGSWDDYNIIAVREKIEAIMGIIEDLIKDKNYKKTHSENVGIGKTEGKTLTIWENEDYWYCLSEWNCE